MCLSFPESLSSVHSENLFLRQPWASLHSVQPPLSHKTVLFFRAQVTMRSSNYVLDKPDPSLRWNSCNNFYKDKTLCCWEVEAPNRDCNLPNNHFANKQQMSNFKLHIPWTVHCFQCLSEDPLRSANFSKKISQMDSHVHII